MRNKINIFFFTFLINILFCLNLFANEQFTFDVSELEISDNGNRIKGFNRGKIVSDNGLEIQADIFDYNKITNILNVSGNVEIEDKIKNFIISAENIIYLKNENKIISENNSKIIDKLGRTINADKISYNTIENTFNAVGNVDAGGTITLRTTNSNVTLNADSDGDGTGTFYGGTITINSGSGNVIIRGSTIANEGYSVVGTGTLTIESNAASFGSTFTSSYLSEAATLTGLTIGKSTNTSTVTMNSAISIAGAVTIYGNDINLNQAITGSGNITITAAQDIWMNTGFTQIYSTGSGNFIKLLAKRNISNLTNAPSITLTTNGGDILVASDTDNSGGGVITIATGSSFESNGGDITIAGGSTTGSGYAKGYSSLHGLVKV